MDNEQLKRLVAGIFDRAAPTYDSVAGSYFSFFGPRLIAMTDIHAGDTVLDVACGKGASLIEAAEKTGPLGGTVGVDISLEMVRAARSTAAARGLSNVTVAVMDGERLAIRDVCVDAVVCAFSMHFFPDALRAVQEFARVVLPGGVIALSEWGPMDARWSWESELVGRLPAKPATTRSFDSAALESLLSQAKLRDIQVKTEKLDVYLADEEEWWVWKWSYSFRHLLEQLDAHALDRFKADALARVRDMRDENGVPLTLLALMATAHKPL